MHIAEGLDVLNDGRFPKQARDLREWRLGAWMGSLALERVQKSSFFTADIPPRTDVQIQFKAEPRSHNVRAEVPARFPFPKRNAKSLRRSTVFTTEKYVPDISLDGERRYRHTFDQLVRIAFHQNAVFESARLHLIRVRHQIFRPRSVRTHGYEAPFHGCWKSGPSAPAKIRTLPQVRPFLRLHPQGFAEPLVAARPLVGAEVHGFSVGTEVPGEGFLHGV